MVKNSEHKIIPQDEGLPDYQSIILPSQVAKWKRIWKGPHLMHYNRLFMLVVVINLALSIKGFQEHWWHNSTGINLGLIANIAVINISAAILIRQQYIINFLFAIATSVPISWPLSIRRLMGKIYHFGGIHVGGAIMGSLWYLVFIVSLTYQYINNLPGVSLLSLVITYVILGLLIAITITALPRFRARYHDNFELIHRFGGWATLLLFWVHSVLFISENMGALTLIEALWSSTSIGCLFMVTISIAIPWLRLKKVPVQIESPSSHVAIAKFNYGVTPFAGSSTALSRNPLKEWHSFANIPSPHEKGFRLTISRAGDWTGSFIDDLPSHVWVKGIPTAGVGNIDKLFKKVVWVATGSGIGPCLPHLLTQSTPSILVWATRNPRKTYGDKLVNEIEAVQPHAIIWDTDTHGKPDLVKLGYLAYKTFEAEAIICISNKKLTWQVVYGMESRNIPAYGAIWDS